MIAPGDRVLVAVSGGKDSLALWDILLRLGYSTDGVYIGLGIKGYSDDSGRLRQAFRRQNAEPSLVDVDLPRDYGYDVKTGAAADHRVPCSACGLSKRHIFDRAALDGGYDVVATGHNLDDEAAVLLGNVLHWDLAYMARQRPVLPGGDGFPRKVKPLIRLGERETAAYCVLSGIDYQVEECPMSVGNRQLGYKDALNAIEERSPGTKAAFYSGFLERGAELVAHAGVRWARKPPPVLEMRRPDDVARGVRLLPPGRAGHERAAPPAPGGHTVSSGGRPFEPGDRVLLFDTKGRRYLVSLEKGGEFHSHTGTVAHDVILGQDEGSTVRSSRGARYIAVRPTLAEVVLKMPRGAQVIYPKDLGPILVMADIFPDAARARSGPGFRRPVDGAFARGRRCHRVRNARRTSPLARSGQRDRLPRRGRARPVPRARCATFTKASTKKASTVCSWTCPSRGAP